MAEAARAGAERGAELSRKRLVIESRHVFELRNGMPLARAVGDARPHAPQALRRQHRSCRRDAGYRAQQIGRGDHQLGPCHIVYRRVGIPERARRAEARRLHNRASDELQWCATQRLPKPSSVPAVLSCVSSGRRM